MAGGVEAPWGFPFCTHRSRRRQTSSGRSPGAGRRAPRRPPPRPPPSGPNAPRRRQRPGRWSRAGRPRPRPGCRSTRPRRASWRGGRLRASPCAAGRPAWRAGSGGGGGGSGAGCGARRSAATRSARCGWCAAATENDMPLVQSRPTHVPSTTQLPSALGAPVSVAGSCSFLTFSRWPCADLTQCARAVRPPAVPDRAQRFKANRNSLLRRSLRAGQPSTGGGQHNEFQTRASAPLHCNPIPGRPARATPSLLERGQREACLSVGLRYTRVILPSLLARITHATGLLKPGDVVSPARGARRGGSVGIWLLSHSNSHPSLVLVRFSRIQVVLIVKKSLGLPRGRLPYVPWLFVVFVFDCKC